MIGGKKYKGELGAKGVSTEIKSIIVNIIRWKTLKV
jgi:hypothetical protein